MEDKAILKFLADVIKKHGIDVLLPTGTNGISFVIANKEALSEFVAIPPLPDRKSFEIANNKWLLSRFLEENGIPGPKTILFTDSNPGKALQDIEYPVLLKPVRAAGGSGIQRFESPIDFQRYLQRQDMEKLQGRFILQSFLPGSIVDFNVLAVQGKILATTLQRGVTPDKQNFAPSQAIKFIKDEKLFDASRQLFSALAWSGYANVDALYESRSNAIYILDLNARFWGNLMGSLIAGVNFPYLACLAALHIPFSPPDYKLAQYYQVSSALREGLFRPRHKISEQRVSFQETGLRFLLLDPLPKIVERIQEKIC